MSSFDKNDANVELDGKQKMDALDVLRAFPGKALVSDLYDDDQEFSDAITGVFGDSFEYPDFSHLTMDQVVKKAEKEVAKDLPSPQELTLSEFSEFAMVVKLENHGRQWEVFYGKDSMGFADGASVSGALKQAHFGAVNNAIYANSPDTPDFMRSTKVLPPEHVVAEYPELKVRFADIFSALRNRVSNYIEVPTMTAESKSSLADGEVLGRDADAGLIQWDAKTGARYNSGQTVEEFGLENLSAAELKRLNLQGNVDCEVAVHKLIEAVQTHQTAQVERNTELLGRNQAAMAERAFEAYNFGEGVAVAGVSGWEYYSAGHERSREVYVENVTNDGKEKPSTRLGFTVRFDPQTGVLAEAYAEDATGSAFGCMPEGQLEKLNGRQAAETVLGERADELLGGDGKVRGIGLSPLAGVEMVSSGSFFGSVEAVTAEVIVQKAGRGRVVGHEMARFGGVLPAVGEVVDLTHKDGRVSFVVEQDKGRGTER